MTARRPRWLAGLALLMSLPAFALPGYETVRAEFRSSDATLLARDGRPLHRLRIDLQTHSGAWPLWITPLRASAEGQRSRFSMGPSE